MRMDARSAKRGGALAAAEDAVAAAAAAAVAMASRDSQAAGAAAARVMTGMDALREASRQAAAWVEAEDPAAPLLAERLSAADATAATNLAEAKALAARLEKSVLQTLDAAVKSAGAVRNKASK